MFGKVVLLGVVPAAYEQHQIQGEGCSYAVLAWKVEKVISGAMGRKTGLEENLLERTNEDQKLLSVQEYYKYLKLQTKFFPSHLWPKHEATGHKSIEKNEDP